MLDRILALLKENGITAKKLTSDLEISNSSVSDWKKGSKPSCDVVVKLAKYFGVSTDYILLGEKSISISQEDQDILKLFHQKILSGFSRYWTARQIYVATVQLLVWLCGGMHALPNAVVFMFPWSPMVISSTICVR